MSSSSSSSSPTFLIDLKVAIRLTEQLAQFLDRPNANLPSLCRPPPARKGKPMSEQLASQNLYISTLAWHHLSSLHKSAVNQIARNKAAFLKDFPPRKDAATVLASRCSTKEDRQAIIEDLWQAGSGAQGKGSSKSNYGNDALRWKIAREISSIISIDKKERDEKRGEKMEEAIEAARVEERILKPEQIEPLVKEFDAARGLTITGKAYSRAKDEFDQLDATLDKPRVARMVEDIHFFEPGRGRTGGVAVGTEFFDSYEQPQNLPGIILEPQRLTTFVSRIHALREATKNDSKKDKITKLEEAAKDLETKKKEYSKQALSIQVPQQHDELLGGDGNPTLIKAEDYGEDAKISSLELFILDWEVCIRFLERKIKEREREREPFNPQMQPQAESSRSAAPTRSRDDRSSSSDIEGRPPTKGARHAEQGQPVSTLGASGGGASGGGAPGRAGSGAGAPSGGGSAGGSSGGGGSGKGISGTGDAGGGGPGKVVPGKVVPGKSGSGGASSGGGGSDKGSAGTGGSGGGGPGKVVPGKSGSGGASSGGGGSDKGSAGTGGSGKEGSGGGASSKGGSGGAGSGGAGSGKGSSGTGGPGKGGLGKGRA
ncbi:MAG: hypothetical protein M1822_006243 [Bathelium mastoideum]|nr:MAG: hypothetical protein M1822_006243 [Bathelium mastoideum]